MHLLFYFLHSCIPTPGMQYVNTICLFPCQEFHSTSADSDIAQKSQIGQPNMYQAILPLKLMLLKTKNPGMFSLLDRFMDHIEFRAKTEYWNECQETVVDRIRYCPLNYIVHAQWRRG